MSVTRNCKHCGEPIPPSRLEALPNTYECVNCSSVSPVKGFMTWEHKTAPTINIVNDKQHAQAQAQSRRGFHASIGVDNYNNPRVVKSVEAAKGLREVGDLIREVPDPVYKVVPSPTTHPPSRCHPDRPKVSPDGRCLECALLWYKQRLRK